MCRGLVSAANTAATFCLVHFAGAAWYTVRDMNIIIIIYKLDTSCAHVCMTKIGLDEIFSPVKISHYTYHQPSDQNTVTMHSIVHV